MKCPDPGLQGSVDHLCASLCSNQVEAEVIVHSESSDAGKEKAEEAGGHGNDPHTPQRPLLSGTTYSPLRSSVLSGDEDTAINASHDAPNVHPMKSVVNHNGELEARAVQLSSDLEPQRDGGLTNGFHSQKDMCSVRRSDHLENRDSRHCPLPPGKVISSGLSSAPFVSSGLVHSTSAAHTYLCP